MVKKAYFTTFKTAGSFDKTFYSVFGLVVVVVCVHVKCFSMNFICILAC